MTPDHVMPSMAAGDGEVMASIDDAESVERLVLADISRDDAWLSMTLGDAVVLADQQ